MFSNMCRLRCDSLLFVSKLLIATQSEAGCRILINTLLIHVASNLETEASGVVIAPEFRVNDTLLGCTKHSFGGVVDYMLIYGDKHVRGDPVYRYPTFYLTLHLDRIVKSKAFAFNDPEIYKLLKCNIYQAKPEELFTPTTSLPQAAMAAIIKAQQLQCVNLIQGNSDLTKPKPQD